MSRAVGTLLPLRTHGGAYMTLRPDHLSGFRFSALLNGSSVHLTFILLPESRTLFPNSALCPLKTFFPCFLSMENPDRVVPSTG